MKVLELYERYYDLIPKNKLKELSTLDSSKVIMDTLSCWVMIIAAWIIVYFFPYWWVAAIASPFIGLKYYALFIIGHDGMHSRLFSNRHKNEFFCDLFIFAPIGAITRINKRNHLLHHKFLSSEHDPDIFKHSCHGKENHINFLFFLTGFQKLINALLLVYLNKHKQNETTQKETQKVNLGNIEKHTKKDLFLLAIWQLVLFVGLTYLFGWWGYIVLWVIPVYITLLLDNIRSFSEHSHPEPDSLADEHRLITYLPNPIERVVFAPMNMHHHVAHHLWPSIPYYNLSKATAEMQKDERSKELEWRTSYISHLLNWFREVPIKCHENTINSPS